MSEKQKCDGAVRLHLGDLNSGCGIRHRRLLKGWTERRREWCKNC
jgi:hypothetical protein